MNKRDYELIAATLRELKHDAPWRKAVIEHFIAALDADPYSPAFDKERFRKAVFQGETP